MKRIFMIFLLLLFIFKGYSQTTIEAASKLTAVTVYPEQAQLEYTGTLTLPAGESRVLFTNLSPDLGSSGIQLKLSEAGVRVEEISAFPNFLRKKEADQQVDRLVHRQDSLQKILDWAKHQKEVLEGQEAVLNANKQVANHQLSEVQQWLAYYGNELTRIRRELMENAAATQSNQAALTAIQSQIGQYRNGGHQVSREVEAVLQSSKAVRLNYSLIVMVTNASWEPVYDIYTTALDAPLQVRFKATIQQATGENWENVKLSISTARPTSDHTQPVPKPGYARIRHFSPVDTVVTFDPETYQESIQVVRNDLNFSEEEWNDKTYSFTSSTYHLNQNRTVTTDRYGHTFIVREFALPAKIQHYAAPRYTPHVYLVAEIINNSQYDLRMATADVYSENTFVGTVPLNVKSTSDTLQISLGIDQDVFIQRERRDFGASQWLGAYRQQTFDFAISLRNNKTVPIEVKLLDQVPVSTDKQIEITLLKKDNAEYDEKDGMLTWRVRCAPGSTETRGFSYKIKYPKDEIVDGKW